MEQIEPSVNAVIYAGRDLVHNVKLREILYMVVQAGNFLNNVSYIIFEDLYVRISLLHFI